MCTYKVLENEIMWVENGFEFAGERGFKEICYLQKVKKEKKVGRQIEILLKIDAKREWACPLNP